MNYNDFYNESIHEPEQFWAKQAEQIAWYKKPGIILNNLGLFSAITSEILIFFWRLISG